MTSHAIEKIEYGSADYHESLAWRNRILRQPLGMTLSPGDTAGEDRQRHFVLREGDSILAGVISVEVDHRTVRLRQMWVRDDMAGSGLGRVLLAAVERILKTERVGTITLHARVVVRRFYEKYGYSAEGGIFEEIGMPHIRMTRRITPG